MEVLSEGNTKAEMDRKLRDYFQAGVRLVWYIEPKTRTARAYTSVNEWTEIGPNDLLSGGDVLPGLELPLARVLRGWKGRGASERRCEKQSRGLDLGRVTWIKLSPWG